MPPEIRKRRHDGRRAVLSTLCAAGVGDAWKDLERTTRESSLDLLSPKAETSLKRHLQRRLEEITRPCFELEWESFIAAMDSLGFGMNADSPVTARMFLRDGPSERLCAIWKKFPVLRRLWSIAINQWRKHATEILHRAAKDAKMLARVFFNGRAIRRIKDVRPGLSDPHHDGRSVTMIEFDAGCVIYKPRSGASESAWFSFVELLNRRGFHPELRAARVLRRPGYYWMECIKPESCQSESAVRGFHERLGGIIALTHLLKAVDCHRDNLIASGEHPILVDVDALWHVSPLTQTQSPAVVLYRTGFFPNSRPNSLQSRSSVLGGIQKDSHVARLKGKYVSFPSHANEIVKGFARAWVCLIGTPGRAASFRRKLRLVQSEKRRWIYWATEKYAAILKASLQPSALRTTTAREKRLRELCSGRTVDNAIVRAEVAALRRLDIPYFVRRTHEWMPPDKQDVPGELTHAIREALGWIVRPD